MMDIMHSHLTPANKVRITHAVSYNPYIWVDTAWKEMVQNSSQWSNLETHCIDGDYASVVIKASPIGSVYVYNSILPEDEWYSSLTNIARASYLNWGNHTIAAFTGYVAATTIKDTFDLMGLDEQVLISLSSKQKQDMAFYGLNQVPLRLYNISTEQLGALAAATDVADYDGTIYLDSIERNSTQHDSYEWQVSEISDSQSYMVYLHANEYYVTKPLLLGNNEGASVAYTVLPHLSVSGNTTDVYLRNITTPTLAGSKTYMAVPADTWQNIALPMPAMTFTTSGVQNASADMQSRLTWAMSPLPAISHRRTVAVDYMAHLKANDTSQFVIQQSDLPLYYMEQQDKPDITDDYAAHALILKDSSASSSNSNGITWRAIYNSTNDTYEFCNWQDTNISMGFYNIWYVTGAGNTNMNVNSNVDVKLTSTGTTNEYYITQETPSGTTVTLARVDHTHDSTHDVNGVLTSWPMACTAV